MSTINRTMFPLQTSFSQISKLQARFATLQVQLGTGKKATNLAELGGDRYYDLSIRNRLARIDGYQANITTSQLRFSMLDNTVSRLDAIESTARTAITPASYGTSNINFGTAPSQALSSLDEVLNLLNTDIDGRYLFGGTSTDTKPVESTSAIMDGVAGRAGFRTVVGERKAADLGVNGLGRLEATAAGGTVTLAEDGAHPFGFKLSTLASSSASIALTQPTGTPQSLSVTFNAAPTAGETVTIGLSLPDGTEEAITLKAVTGTPGAGEYQIGTSSPGTTTATQASVATAPGTFTVNGRSFSINSGDDATTIAGLINADTLSGVTATVGTGADAGKLVLTANVGNGDVDVTATVAGIGIATGTYAAVNQQAATAANFSTALQTALGAAANTKLAAASTYAAADNFFNGRGEPVLRVDGPPFATATAVKAATAGDTVLWYKGATQGIKIDDLGRLSTAVNGTTATLRETAPVSAGYGFRLQTVSNGLSNVTATLANTSPDDLSVAFAGLPTPGQSLSIQLGLPDGSSKTVTLKAVSGAAGPGEFSISTDPTPATANAQTAANFGAALKLSLGVAAGQAAGNPRMSVGSKIDDSTTISYGVQANESGTLAMVRSLAAMAVETYTDADPTSKGRFDAMANRNISRLAESHNNEDGSIERVAVELGTAQAVAANVASRHTSYKDQLQTMLDRIEEAPKEEVAMELLALQTQLTASYQATTMISQLSLVNFLK